MERRSPDKPYVPRARIEACPHRRINLPMDRCACFHRRMTESRSITTQHAGKDYLCQACAKCFVSTRLLGRPPVFPLCPFRHRVDVPTSGLNICTSFNRWRNVLTTESHSHSSIKSPHRHPKPSGHGISKDGATGNERRCARRRFVGREGRPFFPDHRQENSRTECLRRVSS